MRFTDELDSDTQHRVQQCDQRLNDPARLQALARTGLMDSPSEQAFDRLAHLAARTLRTPLTIISLVGDTKQFFKASCGLPAPYATTREVPIDGSICRYTLAGEPIIVDDASSDPLLMHHPATKPWGITAFIALPMTSEEGHVLGAFCAVDRVKRKWSEDDIYVMRELTASVMTEIHLRQQLVALQAQREQRERIMAAITHDLRTPISAALMNAQLLAKKTAEMPPLRRSAQRIADSMDRADRMIGDLLDSSRVHAGEGLSVTRVAGDLQALVLQTLEEMTAVHGPRFALESGGPLSAEFDASAMRRVLENLLGNAVKYGQACTPITVRLALVGQSATLSVHNLGDPIDPADQPTLFEPFRRAPQAVRSAHLGWGIGLSLVRSLLVAHGGEVTVVSSREAGTTFTAVFPCFTATA